MRRFFTLFALSFIAFQLPAQDAALAPPSGSITSPVSGCALTTTENVTIRIFNFGPGTINTPFNVSYSINGGPPVVEMIAAPNIPANTSFNYTFVTPADLSLPGTYIIDANVALAGDPTPSNDTYTGYTVNSIAPSAGGTISGPSSVCITGNSGTLTLSGQTGSVLSWEYSTDGGGTWFTLSNTTTSQNYSNLTDTTMYRAVVQNGSCTPANSAPITINIDLPTQGGSTAGSASVCSGTNSGNITLSGHLGSILNWEESTDNGVTWTPIANTTTTQSYTNLVQTTKYRAVVKNSSCDSAYSSVATVTVNPVTVGGTVNPVTTTVCSGSNSGTLTLSGHTGSIIRWEYSTNGGASWTNIANTGVNQNYTNLTTTRLYRVLVRSGVCATAYSSVATINVTAGTTAGTLSSGATVCSGNNSGTLTLTGNTGSIVRWEFSVNGGATWTNIANTTNTENYTNLTTTTRYRVLVQNGTCPTAYSNQVIITVNPVSVGGTISGGAAVCSGSASGTLVLSGNTGNVQNWEYSTDGGATWTTIANTTTSQTYSNLTSTTIYHAIVVSGVCSADTSSDETVTVSPNTVGGTISGSGVVCSGSNSGTLTLSGETGSVLNWEYSTDGGLTWINITNTTNSQNYNNLTTPTMYRAQVKSGVCPAAYSGTATITVDPVSQGGTLYGSTTVCSGSNSGTITLIGHSGSILNWESSADNGATWTAIANNSTTENYLNLADTTIYRALVQNGVCPTDTSSIVTVYVDANSVGGFVTSDDTVCAGSNSAVLTLSGHTGSVTGWERSTDGGITWFNISNTSTTQPYSNLISTTSYRASVKNGVCNAVNSSVVTITVDAAPVAGIVSGSTTVCSGNNSGSLELSGFSGNILSWESSTDNGVTWTTIANTTSTENYLNLTDTTIYRSIVGSGVCPDDTSSSATISIDPPTVPGIISGSDTVCSGTNGGTLTLSGYTGNITGWEFSSDGGNTWIPTTNTTDSVVYSNLGSSRWYRVAVKSGICSATYSDTVAIIVDPLSSGGTMNGTVSACEGISGGLTLTNYTGNISAWESSTDNGATWTNIPNTSPAYNYSGLSDTTWFRAIVTSGVCAPDTSTTAVVTIWPKPVASFTTANVCEGSATVFTNTSTISAGSIQLNLWNFGDGNSSINTSPVHMYSDTGTYQVTLNVTSGFNCTGSDTVNVTVFPVPLATITSSGPLQFCLGDSTILSAPFASNVDYLWSTGDTLQSIVADTSGWFTVTVTDTLTGCFRSDSVETTVFPLPVADAGADSTISLGSTIILSGSGGVSFIWTPSTGLNDPNIAAPEAAPLVTTTYVLAVTDVNGCSDTDSVTITVEPNFDFMITNLVTPNGDGHNDTWYIENIQLYTNNEVSVFNRNGQVVFEANAYDNTWEGTFGGTALPDGTYYYVLRFTDTGQVLKGALTILRNE